MKILKEYKHSLCTMKPNFILIPVSPIEFNDNGAHEFNEILDYVRENCRNKIIRTESGGICIDLKKGAKYPAYDLRYNSTYAEITYICTEGCFRFQFRNHNLTNDKKNGEKKLYGRQAFTKFKQLCLKNNINLDDYAIYNGVDIKKEIEKPLIKLNRELIKDLTLTNAHHVDFHNSYPAGLCNTHPEFRKVIEPLYLSRKTNPENKQILNLTIGFMQSVGSCQAKWAHLSKDAIADNNKRILKLTKELQDAGRTILAYNTDGIWYSGDVYHGEGEGPNLGDWENDHVNCQIRFKSAGSYEFIESGKYYPVVRGTTKLDRIKPRDKWEWGDIYNRDAEPNNYRITEDGIFKDGVRL